MKVSTRTRHGVRAAVELVRQFRSGPLQLRVIAERQAISVKYLEQLMAVLKTAGTVRSVRGARGGYVLARPPHQIRMDEVFHCLEGEVLGLECLDDAGVCNRSADCGARQLWVEVEKAADEVLASVSLETLADVAGGRGRQHYEI